MYRSSRHGFRMALQGSGSAWPLFLLLSIRKKLFREQIDLHEMLAKRTHGWSARLMFWREPYKGMVSSFLSITAVTEIQAAHHSNSSALGEAPLHLQHRPKTRRSRTSYMWTSGVDSVTSILMRLIKVAVVRIVAHITLSNVLGFVFARKGHES